MRLSHKKQSKILPVGIFIVPDRSFHKAGNMIFAYRRFIGKIRRSSAYYSVSAIGNNVHICIILPVFFKDFSSFGFAVLSALDAAAPR